MLWEGARFAQQKTHKLHQKTVLILVIKFKWQQQQWWGMNVLFQIIKKIYTQIDSVEICEKFSEKQQNLQ